MSESRYGCSFKVSLRGQELFLAERTDASECVRNYTLISTIFYIVEALHTGMLRIPFSSVVVFES